MFTKKIWTTDKTKPALHVMIPDIFVDVLKKLFVGVASNTLVF